MILEEKDLAILTAAGAKLGGMKPIAPSAKPQESADTVQHREVMLQMKALATAIHALAVRGVDVTVEAPKMFLPKPAPVVVESPKGWEIEVTDRDRDGYMKKLKLTAI